MACRYHHYFHAMHNMLRVLCRGSNNLYKQDHSAKVLALPPHFLRFHFHLHHRHIDCSCHHHPYLQIHQSAHHYWHLCQNFLPGLEYHHYHYPGLYYLAGRPHQNLVNPNLVHYLQNLIYFHLQFEIIHHHLYRKNYQHYHRRWHLPHPLLLHQVRHHCRNRDP